MCSLNVGLSTVVTLDLLHFKFCAVNVVFCISGSLGLPSRAASFSPCLSSTFPFSNSLGVRQGTKGSHPESHLIFNGARRSLAASRQWRPALLGGEVLCISPGRRDFPLWRYSFMLFLALAYGLVSQCFSLRRVPFLVLLHSGVVAQPRDLKGVCLPRQLPIDRVIAANEVFIGHPVRTDDRFIGPEKTAARFERQVRYRKPSSTAYRLAFPRAFCRQLSRPMGAKR